MAFDMNFQPAVRFMVISDVHFDDEPCVEEGRLEKAITTAYGLSDADSRYKKLDAMFVVGDFATSGSEIQMKKFKAITDRLLREETRLVMTLASHEFNRQNGGEEAALERFGRIFGLEPDTHTVINGFHFIAVTCTGGCHFDEKKRDFASKELRAAEEQGGKKPIFFFQHPHITDTVYGSINWGEDELTDILMDYPQIIDFSGHSHAPINDPRSIHQRHFTSLGTGTLSYFELDEFDKIHGTIPPEDDKAAQMLIVEADAEGRVRIYPYDVYSGNFFPYVWKIDEAWNPESFTYTADRYKTQERPFFTPDAEIGVANISEDGCEVTFTQAKTEHDYVDSYDIFVTDKADGLIKKHMNITSRYYLYDMPEKLSQSVQGLLPGHSYTVSVFANSFWNTRSEEPLTAEFSTL